MLALAGLAWACTAQAELQIIPPAYGPAGTQVSVTGNSGTYLPHSVEIRWNSAAGPVIATSETSAQGNADAPSASLDGAVRYQGPFLGDYFGSFA